MIRAGVSAVILACMAGTPALAHEIVAPVARVIDGDTFALALPGPDQRVRLCGVDAPEANDAGGAAAARALRGILGTAPVRCRLVGGGTPCDGRSTMATGGRIVAQCFANGRDVAAELVRQGHARDWQRFSGGHYVASD